MRNLIETELGGPIEQLFDTFELEPFASASIGQVHRAMLAGVPVAVKVQHPGIEQAIDADLKNASMLEGVVGLLGPKALDSRRMLAELAQRFREELDYTLEAKRQNQFRQFNAGDLAIKIPAVFEERSSKRVLTSEPCRESFEWACEQPGSCAARMRGAVALRLPGQPGRRPVQCGSAPGNYLFRRTERSRSSTSAACSRSGRSACSRRG